MAFDGIFASRSFQVHLRGFLVAIKGVSMNFRVIPNGLRKLKRVSMILWTFQWRFETFLWCFKEFQGFLLRGLRSLRSYFKGVTGALGAFL